MIAKVVILCAALAATSASLINTGSSVSSRVMDGHGNYAFEYGIASAGAKRSRSEVGSGYAGPVKTSYTVADSHIAPAASVALGHAGGLGYGIGHGLGYGAGIVGGHGLGYGAGVVAGPALGLGYGAGIVGAHGLGYAGHGLGYAGHGLGYAGHGLGYAGHGLGLGYGAGKLIL